MPAASSGASVNQASIGSHLLGIAQLFRHAIRLGFSFRGSFHYDLGHSQAVYPIGYDGQAYGAQPGLSFPLEIKMRDATVPSTRLTGGKFITARRAE
jgi:hypothetical protein